MRIFIVCPRNKKFRKLKVYLAYASEDAPAVRKVYRRLESLGWVEPWFAPERILPGQDWNLEIENYTLQ